MKAETYERPAISSLFLILALVDLAALAFTALQGRLSTELIAGAVLCLAIGEGLNLLGRIAWRLDQMDRRPAAVPAAAPAALPPSAPEGSTPEQKVEFYRAQIREGLAAEKKTAG